MKNEKLTTTQSRGGQDLKKKKTTKHYQHLVHEHTKKSFYVALLQLEF